MDLGRRSARGSQVRWPFLLALALVAAWGPCVLVVPGAGEAEISGFGGPAQGDDVDLQRMLNSASTSELTLRSSHTGKCKPPSPSCLGEPGPQRPYLFIDPVPVLRSYGMVVESVLCFDIGDPPLSPALCYVQGRYGSVNVLVGPDARLGGLHMRVRRGAPWGWQERPDASRGAPWGWRQRPDASGDSCGRSCPHW